MSFSPEPMLTYGQKQMLVEFADLGDEGLKLCLFVVFCFMGEHRDGMSYQMIATLMNSKSRRTAIRRIQQLEDLGILKKQGATNRYGGDAENRFMIHFEGLAQRQLPRLGHRLRLDGDTSPSNQPELEPSTFQGVTLSHSPRDKVTGPGDFGTPSHGSSHPPHPESLKLTQSHGAMGASSTEHRRPMGKQSGRDWSQIEIKLCKLGCSPDQAAVIRRVTNGDMTIVSAEILRALLLDEPQVARRAGELKRGRIVQVVQAVINKISKNEPIKNLPGLAQSWFERSDQRDYTAEGWHLKQLRGLQHRKRA